MTSFTPILNLPQVAPNQEQKETTINTALAILEAGFNDVKEYDLSSADYTLTTDDFTKWFYHRFTGHTVARTATVPQTPRWFAVKNEGTAALTITTGAPAGQDFNLPAGNRALLVSNGTDVEVIVPDPVGGVGVIGDLSDVDGAAPNTDDFLQWDGSKWGPAPLDVVLNFVELDDTPVDFSGGGGKLVAVKSDESGLEFVTSTANVNAFVDLGDTPGSFSGQAGRHVRVNSSADGLIFESLALTQAADFPSNYSGAAGQFLVVNSGENGVEFNEAAFSGLSDTPADYAGQGGRYVRVKSDESGLEFNNGIAGPDSFQGLTDTPGYSGQGGKLVAVASTEDGLVYGAGFLALDDTPGSYGPAGSVLIVNSGQDGTEFKQLEFTDLADTPAGYTANAFVRVNPTADGFVYDNPTFLSLADVPSAFVGNEGSYLRVKLDGSGLQFVGAPTFTTNFLALTDTPGDYAGHADKVVTVAGNESGLGFTTFEMENLGDVAESKSGNAGKVLAVNSGEDEYEHVNRVADVGFFFAGTSEDGETMVRYVCARAFTVEASGHAGAAGTAAAAETIYSIRKNGTQFGTATFAANASSATFSVTSTSFAAGDIIEILAPGTADGSLADISITLAGVR
mgnify:CR=1 FL=1